MGYKADAKTTANHCFSLDIHYLNKQGYFRNDCITTGNLHQSFKQSGRKLDTSIISNKGKTLTLNYKRNGQELSYQVRITYSDCNYGGGRPWFHCPNTNCNKRVGKLFLVGDYFLCRHCHNLAYETQSMSGAFRLLERAQNIRERLGAASLDTLSPFPPRPKGMHNKTYARLGRTYNNLVAASWGMVANKWGIAN